MLLCRNTLKLASGDSCIEIDPHLAVRQVSHTAPEGISKQRSFVGDSLTLDVPISRITHGVLSSYRYVWCAGRALIKAEGTLARFLHHSPSLIPVLGCKMAVCGHDFIRRESSLLIARIVRCNLRGFCAGSTATRKGFFDLLPARAGSIKILSRITFDLWRPAATRFELIPQIAELVRQLRLVDRGRELL